MRALISIAALLLASAPAQAVELAPLWTLNGLENPESVAVSADGRELYVANVAGEGDVADGRGFISRVSPDGRLIEKTWVTGLNAPKGAIVSGSTLYVSDITRLVAIDIPSGRIAAVHDAPGSDFLNDVAVTPSGQVLVSDSGKARIYALGAAGMDVWAEAPELRAVNGLFPEPTRLVVATMAGKLLAMDYQTRAITLLAEGLGAADGVVPLSGGRYLVSDWRGVVQEVAPDGTHQVILDTRQAGVFQNDMIRLGDTLLAPNLNPGSLSAWRIADPSRSDSRRP